MSRAVRIDVTGLDEWIDGFARLDHVTPAMEQRWHHATGVLFGNTQQAVHVISGDLKRSGRFGTYHSRNLISGDVTYGGTPECDYAVFEARRGGSHDFLTRGFVASIRAFRAAIGEAVGAEVGWWR